MISKKAVVTYFKVLAGIRLERVRKTMKNMIVSTAAKIQTG
jgi:hypothetical protein